MDFSCRGLLIALLGPAGQNVLMKRDGVYATKAHKQPPFGLRLTSKIFIRLLPVLMVVFGFSPGAYLNAQPSGSRPPVVFWLESAQSSGSTTVHFNQSIGQSVAIRVKADTTLLDDSSGTIALSNRIGKVILRVSYPNDKVSYWSYIAPSPYLEDWGADVTNDLFYGAWSGFSVNSGDLRTERALIPNIDPNILPNLLRPGAYNTAILVFLTSPQNQPGLATFSVDVEEVRNLAGELMPAVGTRMTINTVNYRPSSDLSSPLRTNAPIMFELNEIMGRSVPFVHVDSQPPFSTQRFKLIGIDEFGNRTVVKESYPNAQVFKIGRYIGWDALTNVAKMRAYYISR